MASSKYGTLIQLRARNSLLRVGLLSVALGWPSGGVLARTRTLPSHGKIKLASYNYLLRDVHPASQAQANYLQNRLFLVGLKKAERLERQERLNVYDERKFIDKLEGYQSALRRVSAGRTTSAPSIKTIWVLVSVFGDHPDVYDALSLNVPAMSHDSFLPTSQFINILQANGELVPLPLRLEAAQGVDVSEVRSAWSALLKELQSTSRISARSATTFQERVAEFHEKARHSLQSDGHRSGRLEADKYLAALETLSKALFRSKQGDQVRRYLVNGGYGYDGDTVLGLITHMLEHRLAPAQGSAVQLALAEVARPINRVLEQEIALRYERIDSLAAGEGHRPYAAEYRHADQPGTFSHREVSSWRP